MEVRRRLETVSGQCPQNHRVVTYALTTEGKIEIPICRMPITYGDAAAVELPLSPLTTAFKAGSLAEQMMPTARDPTMKNIPNRAYMALNAYLMYARGRFASAATMEMYSGPTTVKHADHKAPRKPSKRPRAPVFRYSMNDPGLLKLRKPYTSWAGFPPTMVMNVKEKRERIKITLPPESQNSNSPYAPTAKILMTLYADLACALNADYTKDRRCFRLPKTLERSVG